MEAVNTLTARLQAAGLLTAVAGLAAFGTLAVCAWAIVALFAWRERRRSRLPRIVGKALDVHALNFGVTRHPGESDESLRARCISRWSSLGRGAAALLLALLPLVGGCIKPQAAGKDRLAAKLAADVRSEDDFLRWTDERQGQIFKRCQVQAVAPEACTRRIKAHQDDVAHMRALLKSRTVTLEAAVKLIDERPADLGGAQ